MIRLRRPRSAVLALRRGLAGALVLAAAVLAVRPPGPPTPAGGSDTVPVTVAAVDLAPGTVLGTGALRSVAFPARLVPVGTSRDPAALAGRVIASGLRAGEPVTDVRLVGRELTSLLPAGQVAAPVRLSDLAVTGLLRAGDRVDVLATTPDAARAESIATRTLVLAASAERPGAGRWGAATTPATDEPARAETSDGLLLLAVDTDTAARLAAASASATLTVTLSAP